MKKAYITHVTRNYLEIALNLAKSIRSFSDLPLLIYCINSENEDQDIFTGIENTYVRNINLDLGEESSEDYIGVEGENFYVNRSSLRIYHILCAKTIAIEMALEEGWDEICYLDSDCLATPLVDEIFQWSNLIGNFPIATQGIHEYMIVLEEGRQRGNPFEFTWPTPDVKLCLEWPLMNFLDVSESKRGTYRTTNVILSNQNCKSFVKDWKDLCYLIPRLVDPNKCAPYHEETVYNVLSWKRENKGIPLCYINLGEGFETVKHFYSGESKEGTLRWSDEDHSKRFYMIPDDKRDIKVLHGEKRESEVNLILEYLKNMRA